MSTLINGTVLSDEIILNKQTSTLTLDTDNKYVDKDIQFYLTVQSGTAGAGSIEADVDVQSGGTNNISSVIGTKSTTQPSGYYIKLEASGSGSPTISTAGWIDAGSMTPATATAVKYFPIAAASVTQNTPTIDEATGLVSATTTTTAGYTPALTTAASTLQLSTQSGKTVTPTESQQTAVAAGKYTIGNVLVGAISPSYVGSAIPKNSTSSLIIEGDTVTAPAGYYAEDAAGSVSAGSVKSGSANISSVSVAYDSTNDDFDITGTGNVSAPNIDKAGYISSSKGTKAPNDDGASVNASVSKIAGTTNITGTFTYKPSISKQSTPSGVVNAASGNATTTAPSSGVYVAVKATGGTNQITATPSISTAGYGEASHHGITNGTANVGADDSSVTYVPITITSASVSGKNVTYGTGWITGDTKSVADGATDYAVSSLPSGATSSGTISRGKYIKVGQGWHEDEYYLAQPNSGDKTISSAGTTNVDGYATATVAAGTVKATVSSNTAGSASMSATGITPLESGTSDYYITLSTSPGKVKAKAAGDTAGYVTSSTTNETALTNVSVSGNGTKMYLPTTGVTASVSSNTSGSASMSATGFTPLSSGTSSYYVTLATSPGSVKAKAVGNGTGIVTSSTTNETAETSVAVNGNGNKVYIPVGSVTTSLTADGMSTYFNSGTSSDKNVTLTPKYTNTAGYKPATSSATNNGGTAYYKIKTTSATVNGKDVSYGTGWITGGTSSVADGAISASVSANNSGSASMSATGFTAASSATNYYVTLSTSPGSVKAAATVGTEGYVTSDNNDETTATNVAVTGNGNKVYIPTTGVKASVSSNTAGAASMAATGFTASSSATSYYVTLSTIAGSVKAKAVGNGTGIVTSSTSNETVATSVSVTGNGNKLYIPASSVAEGVTTVSGTTATRGTWSQTVGYTTARTIPYSKFGNTATSGHTYVDISSCEGTPVLKSNDYLYIDKGYTDDIKISLARLVPDASTVGADITSASMVEGYTAYNNDGKIVTGSMQTVASTDLTVSGKTVTIPVGYYTGASNATPVAVSVADGDYTPSVVSGGTNTAAAFTPKTTGTVTNITTTTQPSGTDGTDYWTITPGGDKITGVARAKATATIGTAGYIAAGSKTTSSYSTWNITTNVNAGTTSYIPKAAIAGSSTNATATTTVAPGTVSISKQSTPSGVTNAASGNATTTAPSSGVYVAVKATAAANSTGTTSAISGSGTATVTGAGYAPTTLTGTVSVSGTATAKTSAKDSSMTYVPITTATPAFDGGGLSGTATASSSQATLSDSTNTSGIAITTACTATRADVLYNGAVAGWVSKADNAVALSSGSSAMTAKTYYVNAVTVPSSKTFTVTNNGTATVSSGSATAGNLTVSAYNSSGTAENNKSIVSAGKWVATSVSAAGTYYGRVTVGAGAVSASVSSNTGGSASMAATGFTASSSATNYYVTLSTTAGSVKAKAQGSTAGYITTSTSNETAATSVAVSGNGNKVYIPVASPTFSATPTGGSTASSSTASISNSTNSSGVSIQTAYSINAVAINYASAVKGMLDKSANTATGSNTTAKGSTNGTLYYINGVTMATPSSGSRTFTVTAPSGGTNHTYTFTQGADGRTTIKVDNTLTMAWNATDEALDFIYT